MVLGRDIAASACADGINEKATAREMAVPASSVNGGEVVMAVADAMLIDCKLGIGFEIGAGPQR